MNYSIKDYLFDYICSESGVKLEPVGPDDDRYFDLSWGDQTFTKVMHRITHKEIKFICVPEWAIK